LESARLSLTLSQNLKDGTLVVIQVETVAQAICRSTDVAAKFYINGLTVSVWKVGQPVTVDPENLFLPHARLA
jgi:hypothetical protein